MRGCVPRPSRHLIGVLATALLVALALCPATLRAATGAARHCSVGTVIYTNGILGEHDGGCLVDTGSDGTPNGRATTAAPYIGISAPHTITVGKPFIFTVVTTKPVCKPGLALKMLCVFQWSAEFRNIDGGRSMTLTATSSGPSAACTGQNYGDTTGAPEDNKTFTCHAVIDSAAVSTSGSHPRWALGALVTMFGPGGGSAGAELEVPVVIEPS
jgi:hypothetical protein